MDCLAHLFRTRHKTSTSSLIPVQKMASTQEDHSTAMGGNSEANPVSSQPSVPRWRRLFGGKPKEEAEFNEDQTYRAKATLGILSDKKTDEVPGE